MVEALLFTAIVICGFGLRFVLTRKESIRFRKKPVLTGGEHELFLRLRHALPECLICPHVPVSVLLQPVGASRIRRAALECIAGKKVGYAIFNEKLELLAVVDLDQHGRRSRHAAVRDAYFASAGIQSFRFHAKRMPSQATIRRSIFSRAQGTPAQEPDQSTLDCAATFDFRQPDMPWQNTADAHF